MTRVLIVILIGIAVILGVVSYNIYLIRQQQQIAKEIKERKIVRIVTYRCWQDGDEVNVRCWEIERETGEQ